MAISHVIIHAQVQNHISVNLVPEFEELKDNLNASVFEI